MIKKERKEKNIQCVYPLAVVLIPQKEIHQTRRVNFVLDQ